MSSWIAQFILEEKWFCISFSSKIMHDNCDTFSYVEEEYPFVTGLECLN